MDEQPRSFTASESGWYHVVGGQEPHLARDCAGQCPIGGPVMTGGMSGTYRTFTLADVLTEAELAAQPFRGTTDLNAQLPLHLGQIFAAMGDDERHAFAVAAVRAAQYQVMTASEVLRVLLAYQGQPLRTC